MLSLPWPLALSLALLSSALAATVLLAMRDRMARPVPNAQTFGGPVPVAILFQNDRLVDATEPARRLLATGPRRLRSAQRLIAILSPYFPELDARLKDIEEGGTEMMRDGTTGVTLTAGRFGGVLRLTLENLPESALPPEAEPASLEALDRELDLLQDTLDKAPVIIWKEDADGSVRWANRGYFDLCEARSGQQEVHGWPLPKLLEDGVLNHPEHGSTTRVKLAETESAQPRHFDVLAEKGTELTTYFATPADRLAQAENSLHDFVQTLSRTFADLPTGLAIFDRERRLALFNPALADLTSLDPIFLATRPALPEFLDALRNRQRMPEPKNYKSWRDSIASLEQAAETDSYQEDWSLPTGQTYRVTGQPHPNGGIAFLFEDITAEVSMTRSFRAELELSQSVLDAMDEALAVFSSKGVLVLVNDAYRRLWGNDPSTHLMDANAEDVLLHWRGECQASQNWGMLRGCLAGDGARETLQLSFRLKSGRGLECRTAPMPGHAMLVGFAPQSTSVPVIGTERAVSGGDTRPGQTIGL